MKNPSELPATSYQLPATSYQLPATSYQLPATSFQLPATRYQLPASLPLARRPVSRQRLDESREHAPDLLDLLGNPGVRFSRQELEVSGKKQIILKFVAGTQGVPEESPEVRI
jgi:protein xylosyltransferase